MQENTLTELEVKYLVYYWFKKLTDHAPVEDLIAMLNEKSLEMRFPEATLISINDFKDWYKTVIYKFFDQVHELKMLDIVIDNNQALVHLIVNWQARNWQAPQGYSEWQSVYAHQKWLVDKNAQGQLVITKYIVEKFDPMYQSAATAAPTGQPSFMSTREVVEEYFNCVNQGRWDDYLALFADEIIMDEQMLGHIEGKAALAQGIQALRDNKEFRNYPLDIIVEGEKAMATWNIKTPRPNAKSLDLKGVNYYKIKQGKITYFSNFHDTKVFDN